MPKGVELKPLDARDDRICIGRLLHDAEAQHEQWVRLVNRRQTVISALVDKDNVVTMHGH